MSAFLKPGIILFAAVCAAVPPPTCPLPWLQLSPIPDLSLGLWRRSSRLTLQCLIWSQGSWNKNLTSNPVFSYLTAWPFENNCLLNAAFLCAYSVFRWEMQTYSTWLNKQKKCLMLTITQSLQQIQAQGTFPNKLFWDLQYLDWAGTSGAKPRISYRTACAGTARDRRRGQKAMTSFNEQNIWYMM